MNSNPNNSILSPDRESVTKDEVGAEVLEVGAEVLGVIVWFDIVGDPVGKRILIGEAVAGERVGLIVLSALVGSRLTVGAHVGLLVLSAQLGS
jgi:hypothetical protein